jgi:hypothetical protein
VRTARHASAFLVLAAAVAAALPAASAPPAQGVFVPGVALGGVRLGMTKAEVTTAWGARHGVCTDCARTTWYFNSKPFEPEGAGVVFERGRAVHVFTLWRPEGWRSSDGVELGAPEADVAANLVVSEDRACDGYSTLVVPGENSVSAFYIFQEKLWGFGLLRPELNPCL